MSSVALIENWSEKQKLMINGILHRWLVKKKCLERCHRICLVLNYVQFSIFINLKQEINYFKFVN